MPIPPIHCAGRPKGKLFLCMEIMRVGQSFVIPEKKSRASWGISKKIGICMASRKIENGYRRFWRVK